MRLVILFLTAILFVEIGMVGYGVYETQADKDATFQKFAIQHHCRIQTVVEGYPDIISYICDDHIIYTRKGKI